MIASFLKHGRMKYGQLLYRLIVTIAVDLNSGYRPHCCIIHLID